MKNKIDVSENNLEIETTQELWCEYSDLPSPLAYEDTSHNLDNTKDTDINEGQM